MCEHVLVSVVLPGRVGHTLTRPDGAVESGEKQTDGNK